MPNDVGGTLPCQPSAFTREYLGPTVPFSQEIHTTKYRQPGESFTGLIDRLSRTLADSTAHQSSLEEILGNLRFMPAGRVQSAIGAAKQVTPYNCFVSGTIQDSFVDGPGSIMSLASEAAQTMRMGGGIGYDFSNLRPRGDLIATLGSQSSGPLSFMDIYDAVCRCVASSGHRRGAQMGVLRVDHPDIEEFVSAKTNSTRLTGFNLSIGITDEFMQAVQTGDRFSLRFRGQHRRWVDAQTLWASIMQTTWDWAEPGVLFIDTINRMNNLSYCETIVATNPCGEQPLPPYGACLLGSFNLVKYLSANAHHQTDIMTGEPRWAFNFKALEQDIPHVVNAMDNVVDNALYPLSEQQFEAVSKRRMGLGVTGLANAAEACGFEYGSAGFISFTNKVLETIRDEAYLASSVRARSLGSFEKFEATPYCNSPFIRTLPREIRREIARQGMRNSHLTSIAPTGTISLAADNISSGIEPVFDYQFDRTVRTFEGDRIETVYDYGVHNLGVRGRRSQDVTAEEHVNVLCTVAGRVDSAVSKTCNVSPMMDRDDFANIYMHAWLGGAKGCTTFNSGGKRFGVLVSKPTEEEYAEQRDMSCSIDPVTGKRDCS